MPAAPLEDSLRQPSRRAPAVAHLGGVRRRYAHSMSEQPLEPCPRCKTSTHVRPKLLTFNRPWGHDLEPSDPECHIIVSRVDAQGREHHSGYFLNGFYCDSCGRGFVPESVLREA